uniref:AIG1-type G domain-containing protein n=1 Tax=Seriola lalandi dorsalis TaxID=1841481 RepID=A0A3B4XZF6_SERLL
GNTILGKKEFDCKFSSSPLTLSCEKREGDVQGRRVSVVDTPGLFSSQLSEEQVKTQLEEALKLSSPGPHVFLLTIQLGRFTEQEQKGLKTLEKMLSPNVSEHTMVLFTYGDRLEDTDIDQIIREDKNLQELLKNCYHVFNNRDKDLHQVTELVRKINSMVQRNGGKCYTNEMFEAAERAIKEKMKRLKRENPDIRTHRHTHRHTHTCSLVL